MKGGYHRTMVLCLEAPLARYNSAERQPGRMAAPGCLSTTAKVAVDGHRRLGRSSGEDVAKVKS